MSALPSDASFRRYFRLHDQFGDVAMLMDAPPDKEQVDRYVTVANHLASLGLSAPRIIEQDIDAGFLVLEDFGNDTFTRLIDAGANERALYEGAVDVLVELHGHRGAGDIALPPYDLDRLLIEASLLTDWYYPEKRPKPCPDEVRSAYLGAWTLVIEALPPTNIGLVLRDYHVDNLMRLRGRKGVAGCGLLDFQDALLGPWAYDLVSLLEDARRDIEPELAEAMRRRYFNGVGPSLDQSAFDHWYTVLGAQRHAKVAGIFIRLLRRDGKANYLKHLPRVLGLLGRQLHHPVLAPVQAWFSTHLSDYLDPPQIVADAIGRASS
jgi:aminoglycoside/choline kinase family phosphotransferase